MVFLEDFPFYKTLLFLLERNFLLNDENSRFINFKLLKLKQWAQIIPFIKNQKLFISGRV